MVTPMKTVNSIPRPLGKRVTVKLQITSESDGGIHLPEDIINVGRVVATGKMTSNELVGLNVGDLVFLPKADKAGDKFEVVGDGIYLVVPIDYISAVLEDADADVDADEDLVVEDDLDEDLVDLEDQEDQEDQEEDSKEDD